MPFIGVLCRGSSERELKAAGAVAIYKSGRFAGELGSLRFDAGWDTSGEPPSYVTSRAELRRQAVLSERTDSLQPSLFIGVRARQRNQRLLSQVWLSRRCSLSSNEA